MRPSSDKPMNERIKEAWDIVGPLFGMLCTLALGLIWLVRLESKADENKRRIEIVETRQDALSKELTDQLRLIRENLVEINTTLKLKEKPR